MIIALVGSIGGNRKSSPAFPDFSFFEGKAEVPQKYPIVYNYMEIIFWSLSREKFFALRWRKEKTMQLLLSEDLLLGFGVFTQFSSFPPPSHNIYSCNRRKTKQEKETLMSRKLPPFILSTVPCLLSSSPPRREPIEFKILFRRDQLLITHKKIPARQ